jgi:hypothetical protein
LQMIIRLREMIRKYITTKQIKMNKYSMSGN